MIDKSLGEEREVIGKKTGRASSPVGDIRAGNFMNAVAGGIDCSDITALSSELAKKYDGYKYSISPLKQTNETIMVFQKPYKTGSCLHDTIAYENGDDTCCCNALNIDGNRVGGEIRQKEIYGKMKGDKEPITENIGRYPAQTFVDSETSKILDEQSGNLKGGGAISKHQQNNKSELNFTNGDHSGFVGFNDDGGCSKILHVCDFESEEVDIYHYYPKVSQFERNAGCDEFPITNDNRDNAALSSAKDRQGTSRNSHPTLKPISLNYKILSLFKTPNPQNICYPFAGTGSEIIGGLKAGFDEYEACEINNEYIEIAHARIKYWISVDFELDKTQHEKKQRDNQTIKLDDIF